MDIKKSQAEAFEFKIKTIEAERLTLRKAEKNDAQGMFDNWASDPEVTKFLPWQPHENVEVSKIIINSWIKGYEKNMLDLIIYHKKDKKIIGSIGLIVRNARLNILELGYCMARAYWGQGLMTEAAQAIVSFAFKESTANRIQARHDVDNPASGKVMEKIGMIKEGVLRQSGLNNQGIRDMAVYSILREDYKKG